MTNTVNAIEARGKERRRHSFFVDLLIRMVKEKPLGTFGLVIFLILLFTGIFANFLAPYPLGKIDLTARLLPSFSPNHFLGTDQLGRDEFSNIIYGARISLIIGTAATVIMTIVSVIIGSISGLIGGKFDLVVQRFVDAWLAIPGMLILLTMMSILGKGTWQVIVAIGVPMGIGGSRMVRSAVLAIKEDMYVDAGRSTGGTTSMILWQHILPNIMPVIIIGFSIILGSAILMEASLSFLGFGVPPGVPSWGSMLSQEGRQYAETAPTLSLWPGLALAITVYGVNMLGDAVRDLLDPRLKGGIGRYGSTMKRLRFKAKQTGKSG